ncbi:efflux transporter outer membrane subunit [Rubrivivax benzoatilyticus]|uniref:Efflux transporter outer membrane subunit n=1 Tax=Rubrivivax benzoatilyticus TaxID=316997 RepID=A0ABX0I102_9BURK|nr:efflux transporter outer membrane subunit [Rubrivivax benzoatilyticus]NHL00277.1 efflux transporter outer membrane subunit [Rubrivivax benzoatilyticus]NHL26128.1 efflux transporter outer membrane subunit [Rubrivivax benzoatilyticus]
MIRTLADAVPRRVPRRPLAALALAALAAGCAAPPDRGAPPVPPAAPPGVIRAADAGATVPGWREYFAEPGLQALIAQALANNRDLRIAARRVDEAAAGYGLQRADEGPTIGLQSRGIRYHTPADLSLTRQAGTAGAQSAGLGFSSWEVDLFGRLRALSDSARERWLASEAARRAVELQLVAQVADGYFGLCELDERLALARETVASRRESLRITSRRVEVGSSSRLTLLQVRTLLTQAQSLVATLERERAAQLEALALLAGARPVLPEPLPRLDALAALAPLAPGLPATLLERRPDLVAAEAQLRASRASVAAARAAFFPQVTLTGQWGSASAELSGLFESGSRQWLFTPSIALPLWDWGLRARNLDLAEARRDIAVAQYEKSVQAAFRDVADALSARRWVDEQVLIAGDALAAQRERARLARLRWDTGSSSFLDVLDAERDLLAAQQAEVQARRGALAARVALFAALGGGTAATPSSEPDHLTP